MRRLLWVVCILIAGVLPVQAQDAQQTLENVLSEFVAEDDPAAVIQITTPDDTYTAAAGLADGERPTDADDRFRIGSMSKTFVATVALMLVEEGVFELDDLASDWLPDDVLENLANADVATIRQLLSMRSGVPDYLEEEAFWAAVEEDTTYEWTAEEALTYAYGLPALFEPDEEFYYSNSNYLLMQIVLETASGESLHTLIRELILEPLEMDNTYTQISETLPDGFVSGYEDFDGDGEIEDVSDLNDGAGLGDGGLISNVSDLTTFYRALLQDQTLLSDESMDELLSFEPVDEGTGYSLGLNVWDTELGEAWGHSGGVVGFLSLGVYVPDEEVIIIVLSASSNFAPEDLALSALEAVFE